MMTTNAVRRAVHGLAAAAVLGVAACAGGGPPPKRPPVTVADQVGAIDRGLLVAVWQCRELNPLAGVPDHTTTMAFRTDGTFTSEGRTSPAPGGPPPMVVNTTGSWRIEGDRLVTGNVTSTARSGDGNPLFSALMGLGASMADTMMAGRNGASDVLRLTGSELTLKPFEVEDPPIIACTRVG